MTTKRDPFKNFFVELMMLAVGVIILVPLLIMFLGSLKDPVEAAKATLALPRKWNFDNYLFVIKKGGMIRAFVNSSIITFFSVAVTIIFSSSCGFIISRRKTKVSRNIYKYIFIGIVAPYQIVTTFVLFKILNISGYLSVIILFSAINLPYSTILYEGYIKSIPSDIDESSVMDGAGPVITFFKVIFPLLKPVTITCLITTAIAVWNDLMVPLYLLSSSRYWPLTLTVYNFFGQYSSNWNYVFADLVITALPIVILYLCLQKYIVAGLTAGSVKS